MVMVMVCQTLGIVGVPLMPPAMPIGGVYSVGKMRSQKCAMHQQIATEKRKTSGIRGKAGLEKYKA